MSSILVIDDEQSICDALSGILEDEGYNVAVALDGIEGCHKLSEQDFDLVLLDVWLPKRGGMEVLEDIKKDHPQIEVIIISGHGNIDLAVKAVKLGAFDFLEKPLSLDKTITVVRNALALENLKKENKKLKETLFIDDDMVGSSGAMTRVRELIDQSASTDSRILITGENGTGKELVARSIHQKSKRSDNPFVEVNCAAIPDTLIESELFGHEKGAFTNALSRRKGKFELAHTGTIFLDEIADMSLSAQAKVLRVIQELKFERIGSETSLEVDIRILSATNKNMTELIRKKLFREDLFFRLNVIPIHLPPLRERTDDIEPLVSYFLKKYGSQKQKGGQKEISSGGMETLKKYSWPGNIRELKNFIERITIMSEEQVISSGEVERFLGEKQIDDQENTLPDFIDMKLNDAKDLFEKQFLEQKLQENGFVISKTAESLGIYPSNLHGKIKKLGITIEK
jgi:two-component system, NtrC family, nitrogen regulation response regulator NtrX